MRADRLLSIMLLLEMHERMTAADLARRLEVSERTILRDMEALSAAGIPVMAERGVGGGWRLIEGYRPRLTGLTAEEVQSLFFSRSPSALTDLGFQEANESAWLKLWASLGAQAREQATFVQQRILIDKGGWRDSSQALAALPTFIEALWRSRQVRFEYESALNERGERLVHPLGLVAKGATWYLVASRDGELRSYRVSRASQAVVEADEAIRPEGFELTRYWEESSNRFREQLPEVYATYRIEPGVMRWIRYRGWRLVEQADEGERIRVRLRFDSEEEVVQFALMYGGDAELIEPIELREAIREAARRAAEKHSPPG